MNNNKKYKKWSLGLVAPALVLAPIAVVASCSSSTEEKEAYGVTFTNNDRIKATIHKAVKPFALTEAQFKEEVLAHKSDLFTIEGNLPSDNFLNDNIEINELKKPEENDSTTKEVSAKVKLNKANTSGGSIEKIITLTGLGYEEVTLTDLEYSIQFNEIEQEIQLSDQEEVLVSTITAEKLIDLVLMADNKTKILDITGKDEAKITDEVLANQILSIDGDLDKDINNGKIKFTLKVSNPENGTGEPLTKEITFTGFKVETDTPAAPKYKITLKATSPEKEYEFSEIESELASTYNDVTKIRDLIISKKEEMFVLMGEVPKEESWWKEKLVVTQPNPNDSEGKITFNLVLDDSNTIDPSTDSDSKINEMGIVIKGFQIKIPETGQETTIKSEVSTVTLGLNGSFDEVQEEVNEQWIAEKKEILFEKGTEPVSKETINSVIHEAVADDSSKFNLKFTLTSYYNADGDLTTTSAKEVTIQINGISSNPTKGETLRNKSGTGPLSVALVDPALAEKTYQEYLDDSANIFTKEFVFKYRKHLLTGDFTKIITADDIVKDKVKVVNNDSDKSIEIQFQIAKEKVLPDNHGTDVDIKIKFIGFKTN